MTYTVRSTNDFYTTVVSRLVSETGKKIGRVEAPSDTTLPYAVVYPIDDIGDDGGTLGDAHASTVIEFQVTSVGASAVQAEWMSEQVRTSLVGWSPTGGFGVVEQVGGDGTRRDDGVQPALFRTVDRFSVFAG